MPNPLERLRHHVSGAIARGEAEPIVEQPTPTVALARLIRCRSVRTRQPFNHDGVNMKKATFGSISTGTLRTEDLLDAFAYELERLAPTRDKEARKLIRDARNAEPGSPDADDIVEDLQTALQTYAPAYGYFGAHPGDGADFGFWLYEDWQQMTRDDGVLKVSDTSEVPKNYKGQVLHVNDHGNATLYCTTTRGLREIWSVV